jgi:hypothetical protein
LRGITCGEGFLDCAERDFALVRAGGACFFCALTGAALRAVVLTFEAGAVVVALRALVLRAGAPFAVLPLVEVVRVDLAPDLVALRAGALSEAERFTSGFGRADLPANVRFFTVDVEEL